MRGFNGLKMETKNVEKTIKDAIDDLWRQALKALIVRKNTTHFKQLQQEERENLIFPNMLRNLQRSMLASDVYFKLHELAQLGDLSYDLIKSFRDTVYGVEDKGADIEPMNSSLLDFQFLILSKESPIGQLLDITSANNDAKKKDAPNATDIAQKRDPQEEAKGHDDIKDKAVSPETKQQLLAKAMGQLNYLDNTFQSSRESRPEILEEMASKEKVLHPREDMTTALTTDLFMTKARLLVSYKRTIKLVTELIQQAKTKQRPHGLQCESQNTKPKTDGLQDTQHAAVKDEDDDNEKATSDDHKQIAAHGAAECGDNPTQDEQQQEVENISLANFVDFVAKKIRVNYSDAAVERQREYVEAFLHDVIKTLYELYPGIFDVQMVKSGSFYKGLKIMNPDEFDFLLLWILSVDTLGKMNTKDTRDTHGTKSGQVTLKNDTLIAIFQRMHAELGDELSQELPVIDPKTGSISIYVYVVFQKAVMRCLEHMNGKDDYEKFSVDTTGPSVTVTLLKAPACPTEVDLCLCVHHNHTENGRLILVPVDPIRKDHCPDCDFSDTAFHWTMSICEKPANKQGLDDAHRQIVFVLKYLMTEVFSPRSDTYMLTTAVKRHYEKCLNEQSDEPSKIGKCFREIVANLHRIYDTKYAWDNEDSVKDGRGTKLPDVDFPMVDTAGRIDMAGCRNMLRLRLLTDSVASHPQWRQEWIPWVQDIREQFTTHNVPDSAALLKMLNCLQPYKPDGWS